MKFLFILLILIIFAAPLPAQAANELEIKHSEAEVHNNLSLGAINKKLLEAFTAEKTLKDRRQALIGQNTALTAQFSQINKVPAASAEEFQQRMQGYKSKLDETSAELAAVNGQIPAAEQQTARLREQLNLAVWEARISNTDYPVFSAAGWDWTEDKNGKGLQKLPVLRNKEGKKFLFEAPQNLTAFSSPNCSFWLNDGDVLALWEPEVVEAKPPELAHIKITSLGQIYQIGKPNPPPGCPFGKIIDPAAAK